MDGKIVFEEHMAIPDTLDDSRTFAEGSGKWDQFARQILDIEDERIARMDSNGIEFAILSLNAPRFRRFWTRTRRSKWLPVPTTIWRRPSPNIRIVLRALQPFPCKIRTPPRKS